MNFQSYSADTERLIEETARTLGEERIEIAIDRIASALSAGRVLMVCGNGGSAADAMHITGELVRRFLKERRALKAICLSSNPSVLTGQGGGKLAELADILLDVPSRSTPEIQQVHLCLYHYLCQEVESRCAG